MGEDEYFDRWLRRWERWGMPFRFFDFSELDRMFEDMFREMTERLPRELFRERKLPDGTTIREMGPFVYGYSMSIGPDGKPIIREFGNVKPSTQPTPFGFPRPRLEWREEREPIVDVIQDDGTIRVVAELPGVEKDDIQLRCTETMLTIDVDTPQRKYHKEVEFPAEVNPKISKARYKNGVLEVTLTKAMPRKPSGDTIKIE
jgi:HSP20 family protein